MSTNKNTLRLYWRQIRKYKLSFFTMLFAIPIAALLLDVALPYFLSQAVGTLAEAETSGVWNFLWLALGVALIGVGLNLVGFQTAIQHESAVKRDLVYSTISTLINRDQEFFSNQKIGGLTGKFIDFINAHVMLQDLVILRTLTFVLSMGSGVVIIFNQSPILGLIILGLLVGLIVQVRWSLIKRAPLRKARKELNAELNGSIADSISNNLIVKTFATENREISMIDKISDKYQVVYRKDFKWMSIEGSARLFVMAIVQVLAIAVVAWLMSTDQINLATAIFTIAYLQRVAAQLFSLGEIVNGYDRVFLQAAPMSDILMESNLVTDTPGAKDLEVKKGDIDLKSLDYAYSNNDDLVLEGLDLHIKAGTKVGLVGKSGAGKTTITRLLLRFDDPTDGVIEIDGQDIKNVTQESLRRSISYVPQEPILFHRSLRENIAYGKPDASEEDILHAVKQANALEFIKKQPAGLDTIVGERGVKLSGGQRQRIAIARAILKDAPILILDEATSALDSESEKLIQSSFDNLMKNRTSIVIAHRLSTIAKLDRIIVIDNGKIVEDGGHEELIGKKGIYSKLWSHQSGGFIEE